ncbi:arylamine N-acetyltransferase [Streptomyces sp. TS71-3]|uniref:arylamine N-acetyltransferase family protein n=1 Tax=Streptomyces sp. TS71-3 TaxID=2733862 RepID=UPI0035AB69AC
MTTTPSEEPGLPGPYAARLGLTGAPGADLDGLRAMQRAHIRAIPFENLDPVRGVVPSLEPADIEAKLVRGGRGGYCHEHDILFSHMLTRVGFGVTELGARVVRGAADPAARPRTHMALLVDVPGERTPYLADVGFGERFGLLEPVPLVVDREFEGAGRRHRLVHAPHRGPLPLWVLQAWEDGAWRGQYAFTLDPFERSDFAAANWFVATNPRSPFARRPYVQRSFPDGGHLSLVDHLLTRTDLNGARTEREIPEGGLVPVLTGEFGLTLPADFALA